jgi:hypothetical protein
MSHIRQVTQTLGSPPNFPALIAALAPAIEEHGFAINKLIRQWAMATPAQITGDEDDYALPDEVVVRMSTDAPHTITGFSPSEEGDFHILINVDSTDFVIANEDAGSSAENRVITLTGASVTLVANAIFIMVYDVDSLRWRQLV